MDEPNLPLAAQGLTGEALWLRLLADHGPLVRFALLAPFARALVLSAERVFWVECRSDGFGGGDVTFRLVRAGESMRGGVAHLETREALLFEDPTLAPGPQLAALNRNGWERWSDVPRLPPSPFRSAYDVVDLAAWRDEQGARDRARDEATSETERSTLANHRAARVREAVARNPMTSAATLEALSRAEDERVREAVAARTQEPVVSLPGDAPVATASGDALARLSAQARDASIEVRRRVAADPTASAELLVHLAGDFENAVVAAVASNPSAPTELLRALAQDPFAAVRAGVGGNREAPLAVLTELARDPETFVRTAVSYNPRAPFALRRATRVNEDDD